MIPSFDPLGGRRCAVPNVAMGAEKLLWYSLPAPDAAAKQCLAAVNHSIPEVSIQSTRVDGRRFGPIGTFVSVRAVVVQPSADHPL